MRALIFAAAAVSALALAGCGQKAPKPAEGDMTLGDPAAKVKVVEYASVTCGHCAAWNEEVFPTFKKKYVDTGKVHYTFREMPTPPAEVAAAGFLVARCAGKEKYFHVVDAIMRSHKQMGVDGPQAVLQKIAKDNGLSEAQFQACVSDEKALADFNARAEAAFKDGVEGTPTFFINGQKVDTATTPAQLDAQLEPLLK